MQNKIHQTITSSMALVAVVVSIWTWWYGSIRSQHDLSYKVIALSPAHLGVTFYNAGTFTETIISSKLVLRKNGIEEEFFFCNQKPINVKPNEAVYKELYIPLSFGRRMHLEELIGYKIWYELEVSGTKDGIVTDSVNIGTAKVESYIFNPVSRSIDFSKSRYQWSETYFLFPSADEDDDIQYDSSTCLLGSDS
ncbi:hypothetical protein KB977_002005 [Vibrio parahaemolyticus]|nr:hypothetical protein [Vibrio parahaemolyticus]